MAGFDKDLLAVKNDHNALTAKLDGMMYLKVRVKVIMPPHLQI